MHPGQSVRSAAPYPAAGRWPRSSGLQASFGQASAAAREDHRGGARSPYRCASGPGFRGAHMSGNPTNQESTCFAFATIQNWLSTSPSPTGVRRGLPVLRPIVSRRARPGIARPAANSSLSGTLRTYFPKAWTTRRFNSAFIKDPLEALHPWMKLPRNVLQQEIALVRPVIHMPDKRGNRTSAFTHVR